MYVAPPLLEVLSMVLLSKQTCFILICQWLSESCVIALSDKDVKCQNKKHVCVTVVNFRFVRVDILFSSLLCSASRDNCE